MPYTHKQHFSTKFHLQLFLLHQRSKFRFSCLVSLKFLLLSLIRPSAVKQYLWQKDLFTQNLWGVVQIGGTCWVFQWESNNFSHYLYYLALVATVLIRTDKIALDGPHTACLCKYKKTRQLLSVDHVNLTLFTCPRRLCMVCAPVRLEFRNKLAGMPAASLSAEWLGAASHRMQTHTLVHFQSIPQLDLLLPGFIPSNLTHLIKIRKQILSATLILIYHFSTQVLLSAVLIDLYLLKIILVQKFCIFFSSFHNLRILRRFKKKHHKTRAITDRQPD